METNRKKHYWLHRITGGENALKLSHPLLFDHGILSTGWARCSWDDFVQKSKRGWETFLTEFGYEYPSLGNYRSLWNFLQMQAGDIVVVPTHGEFSIYRVADNNIYTNESLSSIIRKEKLIDQEGKTAYVDNDKKGYSYLFDADGEFIDLGFYRNVIPIAEHVSRSLCDDTLRNYLGHPRTNIDINDIATHVDDVINYIHSMRHIRLDRTFWPVGHGAFYTERFYDCIGKNIFTAVYDCGSGNRWMKVNNKQTYLSTPDVKNLIEGFMPPQYAPGNKKPIQDIDIAFISHLHADHINGFPALLPRIKKLVVPHLSNSNILEALLYNAIRAYIEEDGNDSNMDNLLEDTESDVQQFIIRLAQRELDENITLVEIEENEGNPTEEPIDVDEISSPAQGRSKSVKGGRSLRVKIAPPYDFCWLYKPVNVDFETVKCDDIINQLEQYAADKPLRENDEINWYNVADAIRSAGIKKAIEIYEKVFGITPKTSAKHNCYSMPVYSGPADSNVCTSVHAHLKLHIDWPHWRARLCELDTLSLPFYPEHISLGKRCKLLSCLYMGDFIASDNKKFDQLRRILGDYYDRVGIQQAPHHFSGENRRAELYRGPLFAFGNISGRNDSTFKPEVIEEDIVKFGCNPLVITKDFLTMVQFEYEITIF